MNAFDVSLGGAQHNNYLFQLVIPSNSTLNIPVRSKGGIIPHKKPRWIPPAKSKMFILKRLDHTPKSEIEQLNTLKYNYRAHFNAVTQYLYEVNLYRDGLKGEPVLLSNSQAGPG